MQNLFLYPDTYVKGEGSTRMAMRFGAFRLRVSAAIGGAAWVTVRSCLFVERSPFEEIPAMKVCVDCSLNDQLVFKGVLREGVR